MKLSESREFVVNKTNIQQYSKKNSLTYVSLKEINDALNDNPVLVVVDNQNDEYYNQTEIRKVEGTVEANVVALSNFDFKQDAEKICKQKEEHCIVLYASESTIYQYDGKVDSNEIKEFIESKINNDEYL